MYKVLNHTGQYNGLPTQAGTEDHSQFHRPQRPASIKNFNKYLS